MKKYTFIALVAISVFSCDMITKDTDEEVDKLKDEIQLLQNQIQSLQSEISDLKNSQQSDKASLETQISSLEQSIADLTAAVNDLVDATADDIATLEALIAALQAELDTLKTSLQNLEIIMNEEINAILAKIDSLQNEDQDISAEIQELKDKYGVKEVEATILTKFYTVANPSWATVHYDNESTDYGTSVIFIGVLNVNGVWVNCESYFNYRVRYSSTIYTGSGSGDYTHSGKTGYAALIYDPDKELLQHNIKVLYIQ